MVFYRLSTKLHESNIFSHVCLSTGVEAPCDHYPWCYGPHQTGMSVCPWGWRSHVTITHDAIPNRDPHPQPTPPGYGTKLFRDPQPHSYPATDIWRPRMETWSNLFTWGPPTNDIWRPRLGNLFKLVHLRNPHQCWYMVDTEACVWSASGQYASYWNILLLWYKLWKHSVQKNLQNIVRMICLDHYVDHLIS